MFAWWRRWRKILEYKECCFCKALNPEKTISWGIYGGVRRYNYHQICLATVCNNPEGSGHRKTDMALRILEELEDRARIKREREKRFKEVCQTLKEMECEQ